MDLDLALLDEVSNDITILENVDVPGDSDGDGVADAEDCAAANPGVWAPPAPPRTIRLQQTGGSAGTTFIVWSRPGNAGAATPGFDVIRSANVAAFDLDEPTATCLESNDATDTLATDDDIPARLFAYLVVARNACGTNPGTDSTGTPRIVRSCPS